MGVPAWQIIKRIARASVLNQNSPGEGRAKRELSVKGSVAITNNRKKSVTKASTDYEVDMTVLEEKLGYRIRILERRLNKEFTQKAGMTTVQFSVFSLVATNEGLSQIAIGEALSMDRASTMAIIDKLEVAGLVERKKSVYDRRVHALQLTEKGRKEFVAINNKVNKYDSTFSSRLSDSEMDTLNHYLDKLMGA